MTQSNTGIAILGRDLIVLGVCLLGASFVCSAIFLATRFIDPDGNYIVLPVAWRITWELLVVWLLSLIVLRLTPPVVVPSADSEVKDKRE